MKTVQVQTLTTHTWACPECAAVATIEGTKYEPTLEDQYAQEEFDDAVKQGIDLYTLPETLLCATCLSLFKADYGVTEPE